MVEFAMYSLGNSGRATGTPQGLSNSFGQGLSGKHKQCVPKGQENSSA